jgi:hypothetical protein
MFLHRPRIYIREAATPVTERDIELALSELSASDSAVLAHVASDKRSYVTLLLDPFGSNEEHFSERDNVYLDVEPCATEVVLVQSPWLWYVLRYVVYGLSRHLSSLDYAFGLRSRRAA